MFMGAGPFPGQNTFVAIIILIAILLAALYLLKRHTVPANSYHPALSWLRAGLYFCACLLIASYSGVLVTVISTPLVTAEQLADPLWLALTAVCCVVIMAGYAVIWPKGTFTDGRKLYPLLTLAYGSVWGVCQGLLFLSFWALVERSGLALYWVAIISYLLIGGYNGCLHNFFWDIQVSPPHNYSEWNGRKVLLCHTPNLLVCLSYLTIYGNAGVFVLLQGMALAASAFAMRFPAFWDDYTAVPGQERSITEKTSA